MGILTTTKDPQLEHARSQHVAEDLVCPACKAPFTTTKETLQAVNPDLGMRMHKCPACGHEIWQIALPKA
jgi:hypothetical protein